MLVSHDMLIPNDKVSLQPTSLPSYISAYDINYFYIIVNNILHSVLGKANIEHMYTVWATNGTINSSRYMYIVRTYIYSEQSLLYIEVQENYYDECCNILSSCSVFF